MKIRLRAGMGGLLVLYWAGCPTYAARDSTAINRETLAPALVFAMHSKRPAALQRYIDAMVKDVPRASLAPRQRTVFEGYGRGFTAEELSTPTGLAVSTVRTVIQHARSKLHIAESQGLWLTHALGLVAAPPQDLLDDIRRFEARLTDILVPLFELLKRGFSAQEIEALPGWPGIKARPAIARINRLIAQDPQAAFLRARGKIFGYKVSAWTIAAFAAHGTVSIELLRRDA